MAFEQDMGRIKNALHSIVNDSELSLEQKHNAIRMVKSVARELGQGLVFVRKVEITNPATTKAELITKLMAVSENAIDYENEA